MRGETRGGRRDKKTREKSALVFALVPKVFPFFSIQAGRANARLGGDRGAPLAAGVG